MVLHVQQAAFQVERAKLRAIGKRNLLQQEIESTSHKKLEMEDRVKEKRAELARYKIEYESLKKIETEQLAFIEKLQGNC
jgi:intraflagellar transport protein 20